MPAPRTANQPLLAPCWRGTSVSNSIRPRASLHSVPSGGQVHLPAHFFKVRNDQEVPFSFTLSYFANWKDWVSLWSSTGDSTSKKEEAVVLTVIKAEEKDKSPYNSGSGCVSRRWLGSPSLSWSRRVSVTLTACLCHCWPAHPTPKTSRPNKQMLNKQNIPKANFTTNTSAT